MPSHICVHLSNFTSIGNFSTLLPFSLTGAKTFNSWRKVSHLVSSLQLLNFHCSSSEFSPTPFITLFDQPTSLCVTNGFNCDTHYSAKQRPLQPTYFSSPSECTQRNARDPLLTRAPVATCAMAEPAIDNALLDQVGGGEWLSSGGDRWLGMVARNNGCLNGLTAVI